MELSTLAFVILGFSFSSCAILVDSQDNVNVPTQPSFVSPPPPPPPPPLPSSPPPPFSQSPPQDNVNVPTQPSFVSPPPPPSPPPPSPFSRPSPPPPKPHSRSPNSPPHSKKNETVSSQSPPQTNHNRNVHNEAVNKDKHGAKKVRRERTINAGKKIGLLFMGVAGVLQICVVGFLVFKRQQLLKTKDRHGTCS